MPAETPAYLKQLRSCDISPASADPLLRASVWCRRVRSSTSSARNPQRISGPGSGRRSVADSGPACPVSTPCKPKSATHVGNILTQCQLAVDLDLVDHGITRILIRNARDALGEFFSVFVSPPIAQISLRIELSPFIVKAMGQFMADRSPRVAVIRRRIGRGIEQGRLQDAGWKINIVHLRIVISVDGRRRHAPFSAIHRLAD